MERTVYSLRVSSDFSSSHQLRNYQGRCENLHGHNFQVEVEISGANTDPETGMLMDFKELKEKLAQVLDKLDHRHLNELEYFKEVNPSSENIARFIYQDLKGLLTTREVRLEWVMVAEKDSSRAFYREVHPAYNPGRTS
ncbi:6-carboxytetrahydropterin synthase QueD [Desulfonatronovibrio hydrogenovorans]|uniref:6-carboxytetrahydropterin synthase QueD n=1 Tax=Desulfonatronovibrio hydrogenovorans TaxID=53245 RepID=UPI00048E2579|nr:6-carboxytetrahydropterin synthase QueD [Desulfonatronovibrio hydrogenovorans]